jgi:translation initiation factor IF-2
MRARGANVTDIVIIVVSAADSIMPQTIEAIAHSKAAGVPMIIAVNKIDLPEANPMKVKQDLLQHEVMVEEMGGETLCVEVSAKKKMNLDKLLEAINLQAELMDTIVANPDRKAEGRVVEAKMEKGRGSVATVLIQRGTLNKGEIFVSGSEWGRVRAILNDQGKQIKTAIPGQPVEVLGLNGTPLAGDDFAVVDSEAKAREIVEYRERKKLEAKSTASAAGGFEALFAKAKESGGKTVLPVLIKSDVQGSTEAIIGSLAKITEENDEVDVQILHSGVGGITESDVTLASASGALIVGFNVRANAQARDLAQKNGVTINYYSIIYNVIDDVKAMLSGMLSPNLREELIGYAEIREVFNITKVGKVAGCMITSGFVKRGAKVRLLRDDVVIHEGKLKTLKRHKDEVKDVKEGMECGMAFEKYDDIKQGDMIECFDVIEEARSVA